MPGVLRDRSQAGRLVLEGDPVHGQRPVRGAARPERGVGGCRVVAGFRFLAAEEPDRVALYKALWLLAPRETTGTRASRSWSSGPGRSDRLRRRVRAVTSVRALAPREPEGSALCGVWAAQRAESRFK
jgi:hypothetical protein